MKPPGADDDRMFDGPSGSFLLVCASIIDVLVGGSAPLRYPNQGKELVVIKVVRLIPLIGLACTVAPNGAPPPIADAGLALDAVADTSYRAHALNKKRRLAGSASFGRIRTDHTARTQSKLEYRASSPETASVHTPAPRETHGAGLKSEAAAGTSHNGRAPKGRDVSPSQRPLAG